MADKIKWLLALLILGAGIAGFYYFGDQSTLVRVGGFIVAAGVAAGVAFQTAAGRESWNFVVESRNEVRKVVWPTRKETVQTTMIVVAMVIIIAILLWLIDMFLLWAVRFLTGHGG